MSVFYWLLVVGNAIVIGAALLYGRRVGRACRVAGFVTIPALMLFVVPLVNLVVTDNPPPERWPAVELLLLYFAPIAVEFAVLVLLWRRGCPPIDLD